MIVSGQSERDVVLRPESALRVRKQAVTVGSLAVLVAEATVLSMMAHGFHWNVSGRDFQQLHELFGEIYEDVAESIDPAAENMRKLGAQAPYLLSEFMELSRVPIPGSKPAEPDEMLSALLAANEHVVGTLKMLFQVADMENEQGVADFVAGRIDMHQKWSWQLRESLA